MHTFLCAIFVCTFYQTIKMNTLFIPEFLAHRIYQTQLSLPNILYCLLTFACFTIQFHIFKFFRGMPLRQCLWKALWRQNAVIGWANLSQCKHCWSFDTLTNFPLRNSLSFWCISQNKYDKYDIHMKFHLQINNLPRTRLLRLKITRTDT